MKRAPELTPRRALQTLPPLLPWQPLPRLRSVRSFALCIGSMAVLLSACANTQKSTADTVEHDVQLQQQQAEQKPPVPDNRKLYLSLIEAMQNKGLFYASLAHIDAFERKYGVASDIELLRGDALRDTGQNAAALLAYRAAASRANAGARTWGTADSSDASVDAAAHAEHGIGRVMAAQRDYAQAIDALNQAVVLAPTNVDFLNDLGFAYLASGQTSLARLPIAKAAELGPDNRKVIANLALYLLLSGDANGANDVMVRAKLSDQTIQATRALAQKLSAVALTESSNSSRSTVAHASSDASLSASSSSSSSSAATTVSSTSTSSSLVSSPALSVSNAPADRLSVPIATAPGWRNDSMLDRFGATQ